MHFLAIWVMKDLGAYREKGLTFLSLIHPHAPPPFLLYVDTNNNMILLNECVF